MGQMHNFAPTNAFERASLKFVLTQCYNRDDV